jgi:hypothetical protein
MNSARRRSSHQAPWNVRIGKCRHGLGLFAASAFAPKEIILIFNGKFISFREMLAKGELEANALQIDANLYLDLTPPGLYANHSCSPNAGIVNDRTLIALQPIKAGEEITYDYSTTMWEDNWTMACSCGSSNCRKLVTDFPLLPRLVQQRYLRLGIVQRFIRRRLSQPQRSILMPR